jgi:hypothetical protein
MSSTSIEKLKEANATKDKYMLVRNDSINSKQLLHILQKTPAKYIYKRKGRGFKEFIYVKGHYIKKVLNYVFGWLWDFQVIDKGREGNQVWVLGRLTIKNKKLIPIITKEQFGRAEIKFLKEKAHTSENMVDYGNDLKAAATDSLKKCASELGIASDVYNSEEDRDVEIDIIDIPNTKVPPKTNLTPLERTIVDIRETKNKKTLLNWLVQVDTSKAWTEPQKRVLKENINLQIKTL